MKTPVRVAYTRNHFHQVGKINCRTFHIRLYFVTANDAILKNLKQNKNQPVVLFRSSISTV